jgi:hypothetical protein
MLYRAISSIQACKQVSDRYHYIYYYLLSVPECTALAFILHPTWRTSKVF